MIRIFYHADFDGECSAAIVRDFCKKDYTRKNDTIGFYEINYHLEFPAGVMNKGETISNKDEIWIVDFSLEVDAMRKLLEVTKKVIWIDHHKSSLEKYKGENLNIKGLRKLGEAGCELTFKYCAANLLSFDDKDLDDRLAEMPLAVKLVGDYDEHRADKGEDHVNFHYALGIGNTKPRSKLWQKLFEEEGDKLVASMIKVGKPIRIYAENQEDSLVKQFAFKMKFMGYDCIAFNGRMNSLPFERNFPNEDIYLTFIYIRDKHNRAGFWKCGLYSSKVDVSKLAASFSFRQRKGGGHSGAAGFHTADIFVILESNK